MVKPGFVPEFDWKVPQDVHAAIVGLLDERRLQATFEPETKLSEKIPDRFLDKSPELRQLVSEFDAKMARARRTRPFWMRLIIAAAIGALLATCVVLTRKSPTTTNSNVLLAIGIGALTGPVVWIIASIGGHLQYGAEMRKRRKNPPKIRIRPDRIVCFGAYSILLNRIVGLDSSQFFLKNEIEKVAFHNITVGKSNCDAIILGGHTLLPINPEESIVEIKAIMKQWGYRIQDGKPMLLN